MAHKGRPTYFRRTEIMLRDYKYLEQDIKRLEAELEDRREDMLPNVSTDHVKVGRGSSKTPYDTSQTERYGIRLAEDDGIRGLEELLRERRRTHKHLKEARRLLDKDEMQFVWLRYDKEKSHTETWMTLTEMGLGMSESTYFRFRQKVIDKIARYIGING